MDVIGILSSPVTWIVTASYLLYWYGTSTHDYFSKQGIPGPKPLPYVGSMWGIWRQNLPKNDQKLVKQYGRTLGYFDGTVPHLFTIDPELIKSVFVKDFDHFINRRDFKVTMRVVRKMIGFMHDQQWKDVRSSVTPAFTSGKIKRMSVTIKECADHLVSKFEKITDSQGKMDAKHQFSIFTMDVIARCAFGMTIDNLGENDDQFMKFAKQVFSPASMKSPLVLIAFAFPKIIAAIGEKMFAVEGFNFFIRVLDDVVKQRGNTSEKYHDFIEIATAAILNYTKEVDGQQVPMWDKEEVDEIVIAQCVVFLLAGYETTATTLSNTAYLLAKNPEIQEKLYKNISQKHEKFGEVNHDMILDIPYLDQVMNEVLRMYPTATRVERCCNKDVTYKGVHFKKGTLVSVPSYALHYDEEYYPEPNRFNPDRWSPDSEIKPDPYTYMPFGMGPRNCIGMRFAIEEMKIALCTILLKFRFFPVKETPEEIEFEDGYMAFAIPVSTMIGIEKR